MNYFLIDNFNTMMLDQILGCLLVTADNNEPGETQFCGFGVQKDEFPSGSSMMSFNNPPW